MQVLDLQYNELTSLPETFGQLVNLQVLDLQGNELTSLPETFGQLVNLEWLYLEDDQLTSLPDTITRLVNLQSLDLRSNQLTSLPETFGRLANLQSLDLHSNQLMDLPETFGQLANLQSLDLGNNELTSLPQTIGQLVNLQSLDLGNNELKNLPASFARLEKYKVIGLDDNPLSPALRSVYDAGWTELRAYLCSLEEAELLYEAKLVLVGEGGVGKTTLLKALTGKEPKADEPTTHGVQIEVQALYLPHPGMEGVDIQFNTWDFGGQEVYRVTHQFFFSRRSIYLLVWEPRRGVQQSQVEDWLKLIQLRVGRDARVIIVSTHCRTGERIARIDQPVFREMFGEMIVDFHEVDSLVDDETSGEKTGIAELKRVIADVAVELEQMGMPFNRQWRDARDDLLTLGKTCPCISYSDFSETCEKYGLSSIEVHTLATLMNDLGYIVYYGDDERLKQDVVLQPEWLTKAIGFVLEDRVTAQRDGILPDAHLYNVWYDHNFEGETRYDPELYPFFLQLMEKYDVSYRLETGEGSLVAQHVPQVRPDLPWLPGHDPGLGKHRIALVCMMDEAPPGLVPWMIVRTHDYAYEWDSGRGKHRLHWQKGMFLHNNGHGEAMLELRGREFHIYTEAVYPEYFMNVLQQTLQTLITDNWPGMRDRYDFMVPCQGKKGGEPCKGKFSIDALRNFRAQGVKVYPCSTCYTMQDITQLLQGFEDKEVNIEKILASIKEQLEGLESRMANYMMAIMQAIANEAKEGPRLFTIERVESKRSLTHPRLTADRYRLRLWCEAQDCQHPVTEANEGPGVYEFDATAEWFQQVVPYANFIAGVLKTVLPIVAPAVNVYFGPKTIDDSVWNDRIDLMKELADVMPKFRVDDPDRVRQGVISEAERSGILALHAFLREHDPHQERLGLNRIPTYTGDYLWLCPRHFADSQSKIPPVIE